VSGSEGPRGLERERPASVVTCRRPVFRPALENSGATSDALATETVNFIGASGGAGRGEVGLMLVPSSQPSDGVAIARVRSILFSGETGTWGQKDMHA
jgi:hypothetical protein